MRADLIWRRGVAAVQHGADRAKRDRELGGLDDNDAFKHFTGAEFLAAQRGVTGFPARRLAPVEWRRVDPAFVELLAETLRLRRVGADPHERYRERK